MKLTTTATCSWPDCTKPPRAREKPTGPAPTRCDAHSARRGERYQAPPCTGCGKGRNGRQDHEAECPVAYKRSPAASPPALELAARGASLPPGQKQALQSALREIGRGVQRALTILSQAPGAWTCPACGPLLGEPLHGQDERMHCPNDGCDAVVEVSGAEPNRRPAADLPFSKQVGAAWRGRAGTVVTPGEG